MHIHHTSASIPVNAPTRCSSVSIVYTCDHDLRGCQKERTKKPLPFCDILPVVLLWPLHYTVTGQYPPVLRICQSHCGNLHSGEDTSWRFGSAPSDGGGLIPIRGLTFPSRSSNGAFSGGQKSCAPGLFPWGLDESSEQKVKASGGVSL